MFVAESRRGRRLVGRLDRGVDVLEGLAAVCRLRKVRSAEVRASGALEGATLGEWDQRARVMKAPRRIDAQLELLGLHGTVSERDGKLVVQARASVSRERDNGIELLGGQLLAGRVFSVEFVLEVFDDLLLRRAPDANTGLPLWREAVSLEETPPEDRAPPRWEDVMAVSQSAQTPSSQVPSKQNVAPPPAPEPVEEEPLVAASEAAPSPVEDDVHPAPGDFIEHPKFGRMQVERIEGEYEFVSARLRNQRLIRLSLDVLTLTFVGQEDGHNLFRAVAGR
jgi:predicted DNA-binding protein with PD1-like motif